MAPSAPKTRPSIRTKSKSKSSNSASTSTPKSGSGLISRPNSSSIQREGFQSSSSSSFSNTKKDKRTIKHSSLISRIEKAHKKPLKRRRPSKKLVANLESLADALPNVEDLVSSAKVNGVTDGIEGGKIKMKSLRSKPGALKRKEKVERMERERFGKNLAQIMGQKEEVDVAMETVVGAGREGVVQSQPSKTANRFAALRAWATANMEKHPGFEKAKE